MHSHPFRECWLWSGNGIHITSFIDLLDGDSYYLFLKSRLFLWPAVKVGFRHTSTVKGTTVASVVFSGLCHGIFSNIFQFRVIGTAHRVGDALLETTHLSHLQLHLGSGCTDVPRSLA